MSTAEHPDALARRIEQLAAASADDPDGAALLALRALRGELGAVRAELGSVRAGTGAVRSDLEGLGGRLAGSVAAARSETSALGRLVEGVTSRLDGLGSRVDAVAEEVRRSLAVGLEREARVSAERGAALEDARGSLEARLAVLEDVLDALSERLEALARDGAGTTTGLLHSLGEGVRSLERQVAEVGRQSGEQLAERDEAIRAELRAALQDAQERAAQDRAAAQDLATTVREALHGFGAALDRGLSGVEERLEQVRAQLAEHTGAARGLEQAVGGLRDEWPTRTYEVVEGAKAVAQGVVLDVRDEVAARLAQVRDTLAEAVHGLAQAGSGLDGGTDRLAQAGAVLVGYLEQRDRLLEAERARVLDEVLEAFASGLPADERTALAGRAGDVVARRRDATDAERSGTAALPDDVLDLAPPDAERARREAPVPPAAPPAVRTGSRTVSAVVRPPSARPAPGGTSVLPGPGKRATARAGDRRGRLDVMPEVPSVDVALEAAAPAQGPDSPAASAGEDTAPPTA